jgi:hypothetical protein
LVRGSYSPGIVGGKMSHTVGTATRYKGRYKCSASKFIMNSSKKRLTISKGEIKRVNFVFFLAQEPISRKNFADK